MDELAELKVFDAASVPNHARCRPSQQQVRVWLGGTNFGAGMGSIGHPLRCLRFSMTGSITHQPLRAR